MHSIAFLLHQRAQSLFYSSMAMALGRLGHGGGDHGLPRQVGQAGEHQHDDTGVVDGWMVGWLDKGNCRSGAVDLVRTRSKSAIVCSDGFMP